MFALYRRHTHTQIYVYDIITKTILKELRIITNLLKKTFLFTDNFIFFLIFQHNKEINRLDIMLQKDI